MNRVGLIALFFTITLKIYSQANNDLYIGIKGGITYNIPEFVTSPVKVNFRELENKALFLEHSLLFTWLQQVEGWLMIV